jgi:hypothetical protein
MAAPIEPIPAIVAAYHLIESDSDVDVLVPLHGVAGGEAGSGEFRCRLPVRPHPNAADLPSHASIRVRIDATFPLSPVSVYLEEPEFQGFPHQDAETGKLCLYEEHRAPWTERRLGAYLNWTKEWLTDAAMDQLLRNDDPFELPDFSRHKAPQGLKPPLPLLFEETDQTFSRWAGKVGCSGRVELAQGKSVRALLARRFQDQGGVVSETVYAEGVCEADRNIFGSWILLPDLRFHRQRPPQTYDELSQLCKANRISLDEELYDAWDEDNQSLRASVVLVGCPIPNRVGDPPTEVHWQPLFFETPRLDRNDPRFAPRHGGIKQGALWKAITRSGRFGAKVQIPWGRATNISRERLYARGQLTASVQRRKIALAGCGAVGSLAAELLARGGSHDLSLFDADQFEMGNQCRHTLDGTDLGRNKAEALATRLLSGNPLSNIRGFATSLPLSPDSNLESKGARDALAAADLLLDCTTDEGVFLSLNAMARETRARVASLFVNFSAEILTLCISGRHTSCAKVCRRLYAAIRDGATPVTAATYFREPAKGDLIVPGAGCWHPTFPAINTHLWMLTSAAIDTLCAMLDKPLGTNGTAILIRRNALGSGSLIEIVWQKEYR